MPIWKMSSLCIICPYDPDYPQVCINESCKQFVGEVHEAIACAPGRPKQMDAEYVRNGVAQIFLEVEPLTGERHVEAAQRPTRRDWALLIKGMLVKRYPKAVKMHLVLDNLNTHCIASLCETFKPKEARHLAERLEIRSRPTWESAQHGGDRAERVKRTKS